MADGKTVKAPRGKATLGPAKTTVRRQKPTLWIRVHDTTELGDADTEPHVDPKVVVAALDQRFSWLRSYNYEIELKVEVGLFTSAELAAQGPESRNQIFLANAGVHTTDTKKPLRYHEKNIANLVQEMLDIGALQGANPFEDRSLTDNLTIWPSISFLANGSYFGDTRNNTKVSAVEYWDASIHSAAQTAEIQKHSGEWEAHISEHEIGHTFLGPNHTPKNDNFPNVMQGGYWDYEQTVKLDKAAVDSLGGKDKVDEMFGALPNNSKSTWDGTTGAMVLEYEGYPGFDTDQRKIVSDTIRDRFTKFTGITPPPPRGLKTK